MNRKIKFRAWDKEQEILHPVQDLQFGNNGKTHVFLALGEDICSEGFAPEKFDLMQYTGLKDKNGEEIFEGDVVKFWANPKDYGGYKGHNYIAAVEWDQAFLQFIFSDGHGLKDFEFLEVIGNIYENPELLITEEEE
jgi:uncharacterized phage protein (TIGR01671 family)